MLSDTAGLCFKSDAVDGTLREFSPCFSLCVSVVSVLSDVCATLVCPLVWACVSFAPVRALNYVLAIICCGFSSNA